MLWIWTQALMLTQQARNALDHLSSPSLLSRSQSKHTGAGSLNKTWVESWRDKDVWGSFMEIKRVQYLRFSSIFEVQTWSWHGGIFLETSVYVSYLRSSSHSMKEGNSWRDLKRSSSQMASLPEDCELQLHVSKHATYCRCIILNSQTAYTDDREFGAWFVYDIQAHLLILLETLNLSPLSWG